MAPAWLSAPRAAVSLLDGTPASRFRSEPPARVVAVVFRPRTTGVSVAAQRRVVAVATETAPAARGDEVGTPFMEEMRAAAMRLHSRDQAARDGKKEAQAPMEPPIAKWQPTVEGYLRFLVDSKLVFETLEAIVDRAAIPWYAEFRDTGLERSEPLGKDLEWFRQQGHAIPEPSAPGITYASFLEELSEKDPQAFVCHFYNVYFAHTAGGRIIGEKVAEKTNLQKELEFYEWEGDLSQMQQNVRARLNRVASGWPRAEKNRCLGEMEKAFTYSVDIRRHMFMFP
ncbi:heme oxygenase 1, chloroplastic-like [Miscanthus floridulus]|uniref:heme oxygenase 1, chloroplastic-like n=1 Tax=Miscanthus floridulus TaxID=154761 RepID=UPI0034577E0E